MDCHPQQSEIEYRQMARREQYKEVWINEEISDPNPCAPDKPRLCKLMARLYLPPQRVGGTSEPTDRAFVLTITSRDQEYAEEKIKELIDSALEDGLSAKPL